MQKVFLSVLKKKLGIKKGEPYKIIYEYPTKKLSILIRGELFEPENNISEMLDNVKKQTIKAIIDCKDPQFLILEEKNEGVELQVMYISNNNIKKTSKTTL